MVRSLLRVITLLATLLPVLVMVAVPSALAADTIESRYGATGPANVTTSEVKDADGAVRYRLYYPADLGGARHPIVSWGNGTGAVPDNYPGLLRHLASWGFVVIASTSTDTGTGNEILAGARYLVEADADPAGVFHRRLDTAAVAAAGHSQGAAGAINAASLSAGLIKTVVPVAVPNELWTTIRPTWRFDLAKLRAPVLFLGGSKDLFVSSRWTNRGYYDQIPGAAAVAVLKNADHNTIQVTGGGFLGYLIAWLRYRLVGDGLAAQAFTGTDPEFATNPAWEGQAAKNLSAPVDGGGHPGAY